MAKHRFGSADFSNDGARDLTTETNLVSGANILPKLSAALRDRVLNAATTAYREARRWTQAKQAASLLSLSLLASLLLMPFVAVRTVLLNHHALLVAADSSLHETPAVQLEFAAWSWRLNRDLFGMPNQFKPNERAQPTKERAVLADAAIVSIETPAPRLVTAVETSEGFDSVNSIITARAQLPRVFGVRDLRQADTNRL